ncbi:MAG TPA: glycosyltransferase family 2 protein [Longimicrobiaceae bacterium]|nr:glycosyltransferase family 2 protein [Longimicrobiaceae bacterium]
MSAAALPPPRVSVVTIFLNAERFLDEAVESLLAQTYRDWELVLVDDGSTDGSTAMAREWAARFPERVRYAEHPGHANRGMSASRNLGIRLARGEYVALLDADDVYLPRKLEHQVALLDASPGVGMVYGATEYWYSWTGRPEDAARDRLRTRGLAPGTVFEAPELVHRFLREAARTPCTCGVVMRKDAVEQAGGFEEGFGGMYEDQVFFLKLCLRTAVLVDGECLDRYRQHEDSWCHQELTRGRWRRTSALSDSRQAFLEWLEVFLQDAGIGDRGLLRKVRRELLPYRHPVLVPVWRALAPIHRLRARIDRAVRSARELRPDRPA